MEDHLKNKGRLQKEWENLCRYEPDPGATVAASDPQNESLNRPSAPLPFDHSRVVLNHLANPEGINYINASSIVRVNCFFPASFTIESLVYRPITIPGHQPILPPRVRCPPRWLISGRWFGNRAQSSS